MIDVELQDQDGRPVGMHRLPGVMFPVVLFKGSRAYVPDHGALRELRPGESIVLGSVAPAEA